MAAKYSSNISTTTVKFTKFNDKKINVKMDIIRVGMAC